MSTREYQALGGAESGRCPRSAHAALPAALAFHGAGGGAWEWAHWARAWSAKGARLSAADFHREAALPHTGWMGLVDVLRGRYALHRGQVLMGASFGGLLACALAEPLQARALVLLNPMLPGATCFASTSAVPGTRRWGLKASLTGTVASIPELASTDALIGFRRWVDFNAGLLEEAASLARPPRPICPVLIVASQNDREIDPIALKRIAERWSATLVSVPGSHVSPLLGREWMRAFDAAAAWLRTLRPDQR